MSDNNSRSDDPNQALTGSDLPYPSYGVTTVSGQVTPPGLAYPPSTDHSSPPPQDPHGITYQPSSDPAYPPVNSDEQAAMPTAPPAETSPIASITNGTTNNRQNSESNKPPELPVYSAPPPSYMETFPEFQSSQPQVPQPVMHPPTGYAADCTAPQPQEMVRGHGSVPFEIECPKCHQRVISRVSYVPGMLTYFVACVFILFGGIFGCCLIPFCIDELKDVYHSCPNCKFLISRHDKLS